MSNDRSRAYIDRENGLRSNGPLSVRYDSDNNAERQVSGGGLGVSGSAGTYIRTARIQVDLVSIGSLGDYGKARVPCICPEGESAGYIKPVDRHRHNSDLNPEPSGTLTDRFGYLCLSCTGGTDNPYGPLPIPPQRLNNEPGYQTLPEREIPTPYKYNSGCSRCITILTVIFALTTIAATVIAVLSLSDILNLKDTGSNPVSSYTYCPSSATYNIGEVSDLHCTIPYKDTSTTETHVKAVFVDSATNTTVTYLQSDLAVSGQINTTVDGLFATKTTMEIRRHETGFDIKEAISSVTCCDEGTLTINIAGHTVVNIHITVNVSVQCEADQNASWNTIGSVQCSVCNCYTNPVVASWTQGTTIVGNSSRFTSRSETETDSGVTTYILDINKVHCYDADTYTLTLRDSTTSVFDTSIQVGVTGFTSILEVLKRDRVLIDSTAVARVCLQESQDDMPNKNTSLRYVSTFDDSPWTKMYTLTVDNEYRQTDTLTDNGVEVDVIITAGLLTTEMRFRPLHCKHTGIYHVYIDDILLLNITADINDQYLLEQPKLEEKRSQTGYVEGYNITMYCEGKVGCKQRPITLAPPVENSTLTYKDSGIYTARLEWTIVDISMGLNDTQATCSYTYDTTEYATSQHIYVIPGTFCDDKETDCEYFHPYSGTSSTCNQWISCLLEPDNRPRVKICNPGLYYVKSADQCSGTCDYICPR